MRFKQKKAVAALMINLFLISFLFAAVPALAKLEMVNPFTNDATSSLKPEILYGRILRTVLGLVGTLSLVFFVWGGFTWMTASGNDEKVKEGRDTLLWAILGLTAIFASYAILSVVIDTLTKSTYIKGSL